MKIVLVQPPYEHIYSKIRSNVKLDKKKGKAPPIGIAYIAAVLEEAGLDVKIIDADALNLTIEESVNRINELDPKIVGFTVTTPLFNNGLKIAHELKAVNSGIKTIFGGPHISAMPNETLNNDSVDFIAVNEGEYTFLELTKSFEEGLDFSGITGLGYKKEGKIIINPRRDLIEDLDELPFPARHLMDRDLYRNIYNGKHYTIMISSRGCPYQCIFCDSRATFGHRIRFRSPKNVVDEIEEVVNKHKIDYITFCDDTFTLDKQRTIEICKEIIRRKININFYCSSRANTIDEERLEFLKKAGCDTVTYGLESGDNNILKILKKGITVEQSRKAVMLTKKFGIKTHASYMIGNPGDTLKTIKKTIDLAKELDTDLAQFSIATPFPGTELWDMAKSKGLINTDDFSKYTWYYSPIYINDNISGEELKRLQREAYDTYKQGGQGLK